MTAETKDCPFCGETIKAKTKKCRFCGEFLETGKTREDILAEAAPPAEAGDADESKVQVLVENVVEVLPDVAEITINTLINPASGVTTLVQKVAKRVAKSRKEKKAAEAKVETQLWDGAEGKIGTHGEWLQVQDLDGDKGYVAAWYVVLAGGAAPPSAPPASKPAATGGKQLKVAWSDGLKMHSQPEPTSETVIGKVADQTVVEAIGKPKKYDDRFTFQKVRTPDGKEGCTYKDDATTYLVEA